MNRLIGISGFAFAGKSTVGKFFIQQHGYQLVRFADPLKNMCRALGLTEEEIHGSLKDVPSIRFSGASPRRIMQTLGTEWGRNMINPDFWVRLAENQITEHFNAGKCVVVDDVRFKNEAAAIKSWGGTLIRVIRTHPNTPQLAKHESEMEIMSIQSDLFLGNNGTVEDLYQDITGFITAGML